MFRSILNLDELWWWIPVLDPLLQSVILPYISSFSRLGNSMNHMPLWVGRNLGISTELILCLLRSLNVAWRIMAWWLRQSIFKRYIKKRIDDFFHLELKRISFKVPMREYYYYYYYYYCIWFVNTFLWTSVAICYFRVLLVGELSSILCSMRRVFKWV